MTIRTLNRAPRPPSAPSDGPRPELITYTEAARRLGGVSIRYVERLVDAGKLKRKGKNKARRIVESSLARYIESEDDDG
jgi:excisionase family DNA binding protein